MVCPNIAHRRYHNTDAPVGSQSDRHCFQGHVDCLIDTTKPVWTYTPKHHKTSHKGKNRVIVIGPQGQQVLNAIREMSRSEFVFDPQVGFEEYVRKAFGDKAKARKVGACYTKHGLNTAVRNACDKAGIPRWSPGQQRKTEQRRHVATEILRPHNRFSATAANRPQSDTMLTWICHEPKRTPCSLDDSCLVRRIPVAVEETRRFSANAAVP